MPWFTPTLKDVRSQVRDMVRGQLPGADALIPNSVLRVMSDNQGALCHLTLQYIDWLALQLLPDTAEHEWLDRHANIWLVNSDDTTGRKLATLASGSVLVTGAGGAVLPQYTEMVQIAAAAPTGGPVTYETVEQVTIDANAPTPVNIRAINPGSAGNLDAGANLTMTATPPNIDSTAVVVELTGGTDDETDDELRARVLSRIRQPPMGGDQHDYVQWALAVPGCTRAWCAPQEMGIGTVTVRVMFDDLRADNDGFPLQQDLDAVTAYIDQMRPVTVKDRWVLSPIPQRIDVHIGNLNPDNDAVRADIEASLITMLFNYQAPGQTIYAAWKSYAIMNTPDVISFDLLDTTDDVMPNAGAMAVLGNIFYGE